MYHPRLYGDFYDMGFKYGKLLYDKACFSLPTISDQKKEFGLASYTELKNYYPEAVEEIIGFAKGIKDTPENVGAFLLSLGIFDTTGQCSVFAFKNTHTVIVGRNYDMLFAFKRFTESSLIAPEGKFSYISQSDVFIGRSDGINETGLSIAMSFVNGTQVEPGISFHFIVRKVLENCRTTSEAINLIENTKVSAANNFLIADRSGYIAVVESAPQGTAIRRLEQNEKFIFITNQFISEVMKPFDSGKVEWSKSVERYQALKGQLAAIKQMDLVKAKEVLSNKCVCLDLRKEKFGTIWSVVTNLNDLTIERAETKPRVSNFKPETRLDWWLKKRTEM